MKVFCSYRSSDWETVSAFAARLRSTGLDAWFDHWEITGGQDAVARMDAGIDSCDAALIFISSAWFDGPWAREEYTSLVYRKVEDRIPLIPVMLEDIGSQLPTQLRKLARRSVDDFESIRDDLLGIDRKPGIGTALQAVTTAVSLDIRDLEDGRVGTTLLFDGEPRAWAEEGPVPAGLDLGAARNEQLLADLGGRMGALVFPRGVGTAMDALVDSLRVGTVLDVCVTATDGVVSLPFEAARLPSGRAPVLLPALRMWRSLIDTDRQPPPPAPGPLKILVAVGAPDEGQTPNVPLDIEAEMGSILDAVRQAVRDERAQVRILEVANADTIGQALAEDDYHVLHLSGHGTADSIELEDEDGGAVPVTAADLATRLQATAKVVPLVFVSSCRGGATATGLAFDLHRRGVPRVVAMQANVTDAYATELARGFYRFLSTAPAPRAGIALATARKEIEALRTKEQAPATPEWATATLLLTGGDTPLVDSNLEAVGLRRPPVHATSGPVPVLDMRELIGRRRELRTTMRALRSEERFTADHGEVSGVVLTGIGGVGKSTIAGRAMARLAEEGWMCAVAQGRLSVEACWRALRLALAESRAPWAHRVDELAQATGEDEMDRLQLIVGALRGLPLLLVLDNFEDNLTLDGQAFLDEAGPTLLQLLVDGCQTGKLLITCRYPVPGFMDGLHGVPVGPLSPAETRRLFLRLPGLKKLGPDDVALVRSLVGGHPRVLELLDALLRKGASVDRVRPKLRTLARDEGIDTSERRDVHAAISGAVRLGARDILLDELVAVLDGPEREVLLQVAVSSLAVTAEDLAVALAGEGLDPADIARAARRLVDLSLLVAVEDGLWVHRWTADALRQHEPEETYRQRCRRAGEIRVERMRSESRDVAEGIEATDNFLAAGAFQEAGDIAAGVAQFLSRTSTLQALAFCQRVRLALPPGSDAILYLADQEARALVTLGFTASALERYTELVREQERLVAADSENEDRLRDLSALYISVGDLTRDLGQGEGAMRRFEQSLEIRQRLSDAQPDRPDRLRDLAIPHERLGDLLSRRGQAPEALRSYRRSLDIFKRLADSEPDDADYQRQLSVAHNKVGDIARSLGDADSARASYAEGLDIIRRVSEAEPERADLLRDLSISYNKLGETLSEGGEPREALAYLVDGLEIRQRLLQGEPQRTDYQRDLSVSYNNLGRVMLALGETDQAITMFSSDLDIARQLAEAEPERTDYQEDLAISYTTVADVLKATGEGEKALELYTASLDIRRLLAEVEPERADHLRGLSVSHNRLGTYFRDAGDLVAALEHSRADLEIARQLFALQPGSANAAVDVALSLVQVAQLGPDPAPLLAEADAILRRLEDAGRLPTQGERLLEWLSGTGADAPPEPGNVDP